MNDSELIAKVRDECKAEGVLFTLTRTKSVLIEGGRRCNGYFSDEGNIPELVVARKANNWFITLAHEYSHMQQWKEDIPEWSAYNKYVDWDAILNPKVPKRKRDKSSLSAYNLELDCEKRTVKFFREAGMGKKFISEYIQKSNAYTMFYLFMSDYCKWYEIGKEPYQIEDVWRRFPKTFNFNLEKTYNRLKHLYWQCVKAQ